MSSIELRSVRAIAVKDFRDAVRSSLFWVLSAFFFLLMAAVGYAVGQFEFFEQTTTQEFVFFFSNVTNLIIPLIALLLGWKAIAGERESGSIKVLLSLPHSRKDVVLGKLLGRTAVLAVSLSIGFLVGGIVVAATFGTFSIIEYGIFLGMTILYGLAYVAIAIGISSVAWSTNVAAAFAFGVFALFYVVWNVINIGLQILMSEGYIDGVQYTVEFEGEEFVGERLPNWALFLDTLDPGNAYQNALTVFSSGDNLGTQFQDTIFESGIPFYLQDWFSFLVLLFWIVAPVALSLLWFDRIDL